jgi:hypothetical protein
MKAVREAGRGGRPFTLGEVRGELGVKSQDKRELKRFRSNFRECSQILGDKLEKLGPNTFRLTAGYAEPLLVAPTVAPASSASPAAPLRPTKIKSALRAVPQPASKQPVASAQLDTSSLLERVGVPARPGEEEDLYTQKRRPREQISYEAAQPGNIPRQLSFGERVSSWFGRPRHDDSGTASTALSRLAVELQPKAASFEYRWIDGKLQARTRAAK